MDIDIRLKFGHYYKGENDLNYIFHLQNNKSRCSYSLSLCSIESCFERNFKFRQICKICWKTLSKKEQEELVHYFCVKRLKE